MMRRFSRALDSDIAYGLSRSPLALLSAALLLLFIGCAAGAPWLAPHDPLDVANLSLLDSFKPPFGLPEGEWSFPLGTDNQGRDVFSAIIWGLRISLVISVLAVLSAVAIGTIIGLVAGYAGGAMDALLMRIADIQLTFPSILTALLVDGVIDAALPRALRESLRTFVIIFAIGISLWPGFARAVRGSTLVERNKDYVLAARVIGVPPWRILATHVLPNVLGPVLVLGTLSLGLAIIAEATLSFLGTGLPATQPSLGTLIRLGNEFLMSGQWWVTVFPGLALVGLILAINLLGDWLRDALNPRLR